MSVRAHVCAFLHMCVCVLCVRVLCVLVCTSACVCDGNKGVGVSDAIQNEIICLSQTTRNDATVFSTDVVNNFSQLARMKIN